MWSVDPVEGTRYIATRTDDGQEVLFTPDADALDTSPPLARLRRNLEPTGSRSSRRSR